MSQLYDMTSTQLIADGFRPIHAGDTYDHDFVVQRPASSVLDLTGATLRMTIKDRESSLDANALLLYISTDDTEIDITTAISGEFTVHLKAADTADLAGLWPYDIQATLASGEVVTLARGSIEFLTNVTITTA